MILENGGKTNHCPKNKWLRLAFVLEGKTLFLIFNFFVDTDLSFRLKKF